MLTWPLVFGQPVGVIISLEEVKDLPNFRLKYGNVMSLDAATYLNSLTSSAR